MVERGARILVFGSGLSGRAAAALAEDVGLLPVIVDGHDSIPEGDFSFAVVSPGIPLSHRWLSECSVRAIPVVSELQFGCSEMLRRGWKMLAVTGSKGKSSVVKVTAEAIVLAGDRAVMCGNYGLPVCEAVLREKPCWAVVEVSSFMMETTSLLPDSFEAAVILNLQEDHLDRHGSVDVYHGLKLKLLEMSKCGASRFDVDRERAVFSGSWFDNAILSGNAAAAVFLMRSAGVPECAMRRAFLEFVPLPHRMNKIAELNGIKYVDDSKATSLCALAAGVEMCSSPVRLIAGGRSKGDNPSDVVPVLTDRVKKVYIIGECAESFFAAWNHVVDCEICGTMERAVERAMYEAEKGETVLLSPGTASFDQYENFNERGDAFAYLVKKGKSK